jgi:acylphosphatase
MTRTLHLMIEGRVQGVGYRQWFSRQARALELTGWVRNRADGRVEAIVSGPSAKVDELLEAARRGPRLAVVSKIECQDKAEENLPDFSVRATV